MVSGQITTLDNSPERQYSSRLFRPIENASKQGENQLLDVEDKRIERLYSEDERFLKENLGSSMSQDTRQVSPHPSQQPQPASMESKSATASTPATPPFDSQSYTSYRAPVSPAHESNRDIQRGLPAEGLNGSNVPGLAPSNAPVRSVPASRRTSGGPQSGTTSPDQQRVAANRRSPNGNLADLTTAFDRIAVGGDAKTRSPSLVQTPPHTASATGQQSALQRAMNRSHIEGHPHNGMMAQGEGGMTPVFNERFLFDDDELEADDSAFVKKYNLKEDDNSFPVLIRRDSHPGMLSASSAALDLAPLSQTPPRFPRGPGDDQQNGNVSEWPQFAGRNDARVDGARQTSGSAERFDRFGGDRRGRSERNSPRLSEQSNGAGAGRGMQMTTAPGTPVSGRTSGGSSSDTIPKNSSISRFSASHTPHRLSQGFNEREVEEEISKETERQQQQQQAPRSAKPDISGRGDSGFPSFAIEGFNDVNSTRPSGTQPPGRGFPPYGASFDGRASSADYTRAPSAYFEPFAAPMPSATKQGTNNFSGSTAGGTFGPLSGGDMSAASIGGGATAPGLNGMKARKGELDANTPLEDLHGEIFALCKDQHGCRYLQKKLEEGVPSYRDIIFTETFSHFAELMTDPFGNYLCQKMLEYCTDEQRNLIVESVAPDLVGISLNMHGTRAVQKTIDFLSTSRQIRSIIVALSLNVVTLIKDLNGNHVIQKCLNRLGAEDNQFIYNAVAAHCVEVATHRHGCCVLQRCIDHASDSQRMQLVQEITFNALTLVQDPFGNYVVQYILDLNDARFSDAVIRQFVGSVCLLSVQKFSSNVIEKCIRVSEPGIRKQLIEELLNRTRLEKLLRDSFANYVVQTSLDYADPVQRMQLVECIKPILPMIRTTPYGKRIQSKLQRDNIDMGGAGSGGGGGTAPSQANVPYGMLHAAHQHQLHAMAAIAQRQGSGTGGPPPTGPADGYSTMGSFNPAGHGPMHHSSNAGSRAYGRPNMSTGSPLPPPNMFANPGRPYAQQGGAAHAHATPVGGIYGPSGMTSFGRGSPNHAGSPQVSGFPSQQGYPMQGGFGATIPPSHSGNNAPYQSSYTPF